METIQKHRMRNGSLEIGLAKSAIPIAFRYESVATQYVWVLNDVNEEQTTYKFIAQTEYACSVAKYMTYSMLYDMDNNNVPYFLFYD